MRWAPSLQAREKENVGAHRFLAHALLPALRLPLSLLGLHSSSPWVGEAALKQLSNPEIRSTEADFWI
jgi:hypothetical protein